MVAALLSLFGAQGAHARPVMLDIVGGETAFLVDADRGRAFWVLDECKRPIPIESSSKAGLESAEMRDRVRLGARQVELRQRFRMRLAEPQGASVEVFNSVRGGWAPVPVEVNAGCDREPMCRARMELPECPAAPTR